MPVNHLHGHVASLFLEPLDLEPPFTCLLASGGHTLLLDVRGPRAGTAMRGDRDDARRRRRRGVRQGRAPARAAVPRRRRDRPARARRRPRGLRLPGRARPGPRLLVLGAQDGAPLRRPRPRRRPSSSARRADLAASYQRAIVRALVERIEATGADRVAIVGGVAANSELRASLPGRRRGAARALHRQRRDDRLGGALHRARPAAEYLALDAFASAP